MTEGMTPADVAAVTNHGYGYGYGGGCNGWGNNGMFGMEWIFALLILPMLWGGNGPFGGRGGYGENPVTESGLCNAMNANNLENAVGRLSDQVGNAYTGLQNGLCNIGYQELQNTMSLQRDFGQGIACVISAINAAAQQAQCCCETKQILMENRYLAERSAANSDAVTVAQTQKILDAICGNRMADMQNQINHLQLQQALCGVVRYPNQTTYFAQNPFFGCSCGNGFNGNI